MLKNEPIERLRNEISVSLDRLELLRPSRVDAMEISPVAKLPFLALCHRGSLIWRMTQLCRSAFESFASGHVASGIVLTRAGVETGAALYSLFTKVKASVRADAVGEVTDYIVKLAFGSRDDPEMPQAINVMSMLDNLDKQIDGCRNNYNILSEYSHPNGAGTTRLLSLMDQENLWMDFGVELQQSRNEHVGLSSLYAALVLFEHSFGEMGGLMSQFASVCERDLSRASPA